MTENTWTLERDYALAFGASLGMSARQIAESFGPAVSRNSVIGRCHRLNLGLSGKRRPPPPKVEGSSMPHKTKVSWTPEQDEALRAGIAARRSSREMVVDLGHTESAINSRRKTLGLKTFSMRRFSDEDDAIIKADYAAFVPVEEIALKLGRSIGTLMQRVLHLGLRRDGRKTRLAARFGAEVLAVSDDPAEIRHHLIAVAKAKNDERAAIQEAKIVAAIADMQAVLDGGVERSVAFKAAMLQGATLQAIGDQVGLTRERVRQIVHSRYIPKQPRTVVCARCETTFQAIGRGPRRFCEPCQEIAAEQARQGKLAYSRNYSRRLRATEEGKTYKRAWTRRSRLKEKLKAVEPSELAGMLREIANEIDTRDEAVVQ